jgi:predicted acylesterase/phospholipase RssA
MEKLSGLVDGLVEFLTPNKNGEPRLFDVMAASIDIMQDRITRSRMAGDPPDLVLTPDLGQFQLMDFHRAGEAIAIGRGEVARLASELQQLKERWESPTTKQQRPTPQATSPAMGAGGEGAGLTLFRKHHLL